MDVRLESEPGWPHRPPGRPEPGWPPAAPDPLAGAGVAPWLEQRMFDWRIVLLQGTLTAELATRTAAALLTLDALGTEPVRLHIAASGDDLVAAFALVDALDVMRAPVHAIATAEVGGSAVAVYAAARRRLAFPHARFRLAEPKVNGVAGTADEVTAAAGRYLRALEDLVLRIAAATGQPRSTVENDLTAGRILRAEEAVEYGLVQEIVAGQS
jgi:ATP-dependent Clp protease protease subunit